MVRNSNSHPLEFHVSLRAAVLDRIITLLRELDLSNGLEPEIGKQYLEDCETFEAIAYEEMIQYARQDSFALTYGRTLFPFGSQLYSMVSSIFAYVKDWH